MNSFNIKTGICCLAFLLLAGIQSLHAQSGRFSFEKYINHQDTLQYRMLFPDADNMQKYPLVIFLHGSGERGNDNEAQLKWGAQNFATDEAMSMHPAFVIAPQCPEKEGWSNFDGRDKSTDLKLKPTPSKVMGLVIDLVHEMVKKFAIDTNRIYITGLSMGGFGTYDAIERYPDLFAAAVPVCGGGDVSKAPLIAKMPIWIFHGAEDPAVNPAFSVSMLEALVKAGAHPGFTQYPSTGHFSWLAAYKDQLMMEWLFRQHK
jgi:predicted peptidase